MSLWNTYITYLKDNPNHYWFKRKLFGWGWTPATWEGWLVFIVYIALVIGLALTLDEQSPTREIMFTFVIPVAILTATFIRITCKKGEKPKWTWGLPKDKNLDHE
ncbi:hypothetical protein GW943_01970 [Candidatus Parcubacteria bacterium]|uniref:Uncharacterized protein n=1 Tax=Candidatus Kaiserbacteria bacterium CG10_big_fil_rev_8_21_14_0_10_47_16 TaxID=1974608 RepID=A0A2H0UEE6_9BACT|nr:hypothetical protein [Candidatus Parcubacteria bacterium]PIR84798.1 MAG: hypothetical protein COU16_01265 [Candidatus Kaiserbacteria bacterium CG10_big_fil_rev_8_21_14_0_10_47_16]